MHFRTTCLVNSSLLYARTGEFARSILDQRLIGASLSGFPPTMCLLRLGGQSSSATSSAASSAVKDPPV